MENLNHNPTDNGPARPLRETAMAERRRRRIGRYMDLNGPADNNPIDDTQRKEIGVSKLVAITGEQKNDQGKSNSGNHSVLSPYIATTALQPAYQIAPYNLRHAPTAMTQPQFTYHGLASSAPRARRVNVAAREQVVESDFESSSDSVDSGVGEQNRHLYLNNLLMPGPPPPAHQNSHPYRNQMVPVPRYHNTINSRSNHHNVQTLPNNQVLKDEKKRKASQPSSGINSNSSKGPKMASSVQPSNVAKVTPLTVCNGTMSSAARKLSDGSSRRVYTMAGHGGQDMYRYADGTENVQGNIMSVNVGDKALVDMNQYEEPLKYTDLQNKMVNMQSVKAALKKKQVRRPSLHQPFSARSRDGKWELSIQIQPEDQHRARYLTEGSRGSIKDQKGTGYPVVKLHGYAGQAVTLQIFIGTDQGKVMPHLFYQACRITGKNCTPCTERRIEGTSVIEVQMTKENDMTVSCDCIGILKERNVDVEQRLPFFGAGRLSKKKSNSCRMVFRVCVPLTGGGYDVLQVASIPILCTQAPGCPEVCKRSTSECCVLGGQELFIIGRNFQRDTTIVFQEFEDGNDRVRIVWQENIIPEKEFLHQMHLVCSVPAYYDVNVTKPVRVYITICSGGKTSEMLPFTYLPMESARLRSCSLSSTTSTSDRSSRHGSISLSSGSTKVEFHSDDSQSRDMLSIGLLQTSISNPISYADACAQSSNQPQQLVFKEESSDSIIVTNDNSAESSLVGCIYSDLSNSGSNIMSAVGGNGLIAMTSNGCGPNQRHQPKPTVFTNLSSTPGSSCIGNVQSPAVSGLLGSLESLRQVSPQIQTMMDGSHSTTSLLDNVSQMHALSGMPDGPENATILSPMTVGNISPVIVSPPCVDLSPPISMQPLSHMNYPANNNSPVENMATPMTEPQPPPQNHAYSGSNRMSMIMIGEMFSANQRQCDEMMFTNTNVQISPPSQIRAESFIMPDVHLSPTREGQEHMLVRQPTSPELMPPPPTPMDFAQASCPKSQNASSLLMSECVSMSLSADMHSPAPTSSLDIATTIASTPMDSETSLAAIESIMTPRMAEMGDDGMNPSVESVDPEFQRLIRSTESITAQKTETAPMVVTASDRSEDSSVTTKSSGLPQVIVNGTAGGFHDRLMTFNPLTAVVVPMSQTSDAIAMVVSSADTSRKVSAMDTSEIQEKMTAEFSQMSEKDLLSLINPCAFDQVSMADLSSPASRKDSTCSQSESTPARKTSFVPSFF